MTESSSQRTDTKRHRWRLVARIVAGCLGVFAIAAFIAANNVYSLSGRWFDRAAFVAQCTAPPFTVTASDCSRLREAAPPPFDLGVPVTDKEVLLAEGSTMHNVGTALIAISGVLRSAAALLVALGEVSRR
jgi:hypothetical protein